MKKRILVCGNINVETSVGVEAFPIDYSPVRYPFFGIHSTVSGVGYNLARALTVLGNKVELVSIVGQDLTARQVRDALAGDGIRDRFVLGLAKETAQSVVLYDSSGRRQVYTDLKDIPELSYPLPLFEGAMAACDLLMLTNINYARPFLELARSRSIPIATDVHAISDLEDPYNQDFMRAATILFMSGENLPEPPETWAAQVLERFGTEIVVIGLGEQGALLATRESDTMEHVPAVRTRPVVSTVGAGDALFAAFLHGYLLSGDPRQALQKAVLFASYKIGETGAARGFLDSASLERLYAQTEESSKGSPSPLATSRLPSSREEGENGSA